MMLSEREPFPNFHECFYNSIETRRTFSLFYLENAATEKEGDKLFTLIIKMKILFARAIITSTTRDSSLFLSSFSINLLAFCHECPFLIGFATHYLFSKQIPCCRASVQLQITDEVKMWTEQKSGTRGDRRVCH